MIAAVSCCLSATGIRFSGHPVPAQEFRVPYGRPTRQRRAWTWTGFPRSTPARYDRVGCPLYPGDGGAHPGRMPCPTSACRFTTASPYTALPPPTCAAPDNETSTRVHAIHPSGLPLTCNPRVERGPSGFPSSFAPRRYQRRTSKVGPRREHAPGTRAPTSAGPPIHSSLAKCDLVSQRHFRSCSRAAWCSILTMTADFETWLNEVAPRDELDPGVRPTGAEQWLREIFVRRGPIPVQELRAEGQEIQMDLAQGRGSPRPA